MKRSAPGYNEHGIPTQRLTPKTGRPSKALKGLAVHHCDYPHCGKTYTRKEHLLRHERTHRNELPYVCSDCGQGYARQDLLKRHSSLKHGHSPGLLSESSLTGHRRVSSSNVGSSPHTSPRSMGDGSARPLQHIAHQALPMVQLSIPQRQLSTSSQDLAGFSQMRLSDGRARSRSYSGYSMHSIGDSTKRQLPLPFAPPQRSASVQEDTSVALLRAASYGNVSEVRRLHLTGVDVLATGSFEDGKPKSALIAAADAIHTCLEDLPKTQHSSAREQVWTEIRARVEVVKYLELLGADLNSLASNLREATMTAIRGPVIVSPEIERRTMAGQGVYRQIAPASRDTKLSHIDSGGVGIPAKAEPLSTDVLALVRSKTEDEGEESGSASGSSSKVVGKGKERAF